MGSDEAKLLEAVFSEAPPLSLSAGDDPWNKFKAEMVANRPHLREELLARVRSVQGATGQTPYAIDLTRVLPAIRELSQCWKLDKKFPELNSSRDDEVERVAAYVNDLVKHGQKAVDARVKDILERSRAARRELGPDCDKNALLRAIGEVRERAERHGLTGQVRNAELATMIEKFRDARAMEAIRHVEAISQENDPGKKFAAAAALDVDTHDIVLRFVECCSKWLHERLHETAMTNAYWTQEVVDNKRAEVDKILEALEQTTREIGGVRQ
jgi:hypothetical protein